jgi:hypothetical protein
LLKNELQKVHDKEMAVKEHMADLEQQVTVAKLASGGMDERDKKNFEKTINQYIKEIDKCISFLSQ